MFLRGSILAGAVANIALKLLRQLTKHHVEPSVVGDFGMTRDDAEVIVTLAACMEDLQP